MPVLSEERRAAVNQRLQEWFSGDEASGNLNCDKYQFREIVDDLDQARVDTAAAVNNGIRVSHRALLTTSQKSRIYQEIIGEAYQEGV